MLRFFNVEESQKRIAEQERRKAEEKRMAEHKKIAEAIGITLQDGEDPKAAVERERAQSLECGRQQLASEIGINPAPGGAKSALEEKLKEARTQARREFAAEIGLNLESDESPKAALGKIVAAKTARAIAATGHEPLEVPHPDEEMELEDLRDELAVTKDPQAYKQIYNRIQKLEAKRKASPGEG